MPGSCIIVIPCLNEARHIGPLLAQLLPSSRRLGALVVVADGGSEDATRNIVSAVAADNPDVVLIDNPRRLQSAAVNLAVSRFGGSAEYLIRIDAHGGYPDDYCDRLIKDAHDTGADAVVVSMLTRGSGIVQRAAAAAQNSRLGTGGSKHRHSSLGEWIDHGHHALLRVDAFSAVGGYDESFSHNEDAELDHRLKQAGFRIWLSGRTQMTYFPRNSLKGLYRQYLGYGRGRARNLLKHRLVPKLRQMVPLMVFPAALVAMLTPLHWLFAPPLALWAAICLAYGGRLAWRAGDPKLALAGVSAMVMHFAWSLGFWQQMVGAGVRGRPA
ncbi:glycosyltransferase family 2 protein [Hoeflea sp. 108]|jgi:succinoglycan biosynthesis protein ExoA|uniref:glycosyltransferase family 2 protein n=1 Tax=Hoeflea sp. 108 TaxID=1116369 RepID=UPI000370C88A|nr:glycosyltransferase family 2 protein [Hoeflea sp. 108]